MANVLQFSGPNPGEPFNPAQSQTDLGVFRKVGEVWSINNAIHPPDWNMVLRVRREFDPFFVPLWIDKLWLSPNGGLIRTGHHVIGRCLPPALRLTSAWKRKGPVQIVKPVGIPITIPYPVLPAYTLDGASRERVEKGGLPLYQDFDNGVLRTMRAAVWERNNVPPEEIHRKDEETKARAAEETARRDADARRERLRERIEARKAKVFVSENQRTFVSEELLRLRALAGKTAVSGA